MTTILRCLLISFVFMVLPRTAAADDGIPLGCDGSVCLDWHNESDASNYIQGWIHQVSYGGAAEAWAWAYADASGFVYVAGEEGSIQPWAWSARGDRQYEGVPCDDYGAQGRRMGAQLKTTFENALLGMGGAWIGTIAAGTPAWPGVVMGGLSYMFLNLSYDMWSYSWRCYR